DQLPADAIELERSLALAPPVVARLHLEAQVPEAILPFEVHPIERIGNPADAALSEGDAHVGIALEHAGTDHRGQDIGEVHLEAGDHGEERRPASGPESLLKLTRRYRRERVEVQRKVYFMDGLPQRLPDRMPHRLHVP